MIDFKKLTSMNGKTVFINFSNVTHIRERVTGGTVIVLGKSQGFLEVKEEIEVVMKLINSK